MHGEVLLIYGISFASIILNFYFQNWVKVKFPKWSTFEFKYLSKFNVYYDKKTKVAYDINFMNDVVTINLHKTKKGNFKKYSDDKLVNTKIYFSRNTKFPVTFTFIEDTKFLCNQETNAVYELCSSQEIICLRPYITPAGNKCKYISGNFVELCD